MANGKSSVNVKIDTGVKELAVKILERMGIDQATAIEMFYRQVINEYKLPFQPAVNPTPDERLAGAILNKNIPRVKLEFDEEGNAVVDKEKHPDIYEWLANG